jgi:hypothetical protein
VRKFLKSGQNLFLRKGNEVIWPGNSEKHPFLSIERLVYSKSGRHWKGMKMLLKRGLTLGIFAGQGLNIGVLKILCP